MKHIRCQFPWLVAGFTVIVAALPNRAGAGQMSHEAILTEWATAKGWIVDSFTFSGIGMGFKNKEMQDRDIGIVHDRGHWFETAKPINKTVSGNNLYTVQSLERITVAGGSPAIRTYNLARQSKTPSQEAFEAEGWTYYCHDYRVLVIAERDTRTHYANASDPRGILEDYLAFAQTQLSPESYTFLDPKPAWNLNETNMYILRMAVEHIRKRARALSATDPDMADLLNDYADRILVAPISYKEKPLLGNGEASCSSSGKITIYKAFTDYPIFSRGLVRYELYDPGDLAVIASLLMHEIAHAKGANEWQAHNLQKFTFDALGVSTNAGTWVHNTKYFETFSTPYDLRCQYFYTFWMELNKGKDSPPAAPSTGGYHGNNPKF
ncbi:MAG: hypothetical protein AB7V14_01595 [Kiritimatiellia bacterium]